MVAYCILHIKGCLSSKICLSVVRVGQLVPELELPELDAV